MPTSPELMPSATRQETATLALAVELSKKTWLVAVQAPDRDKISLYRLTGGDIAGLLALITRLRQRAEAALGRPVRVVCCYEAGYDGFWLHRRLVQEGVTNHVIDPASLQVNRRARRAKTDRLDAEALLRALLAHLRGEPKVVSLVRVPSPDDEDLRRQTRERDCLVGERIAHLNRIKGLLMAQGIRDVDPTRPDWLARLAERRTGDGRALPPCLLAELERQGRRLALVLEMLAALEQESAARRAAADAAGAERIRRLMRLVSLGPVIATGLEREVFYRTFENRRQVGQYLGLTATPWCSGTVSRDQGIAKAGNPRARRLAIELAWLWLRHQPDSTLSQWFRERGGAAKGRLRKILIVALARKLMVALWRYLTVGIMPAGAVLKA
jgi:transposase